MLLPPPMTGSLGQKRVHTVNNTGHWRFEGEGPKAYCFPVHGHVRPSNANNKWSYSTLPFMARAAISRFLESDINHLEGVHCLATRLLKGLHHLLHERLHQLKQQITNKGKLAFATPIWATRAHLEDTARAKRCVFWACGGILEQISSFYRVCV